MKVISPANYRFAATQSLFVFIFMAAVLILSGWFFSPAFDPSGGFLPVVLTLAAIGSVSAPTVISSCARSLNVHDSRAYLARGIAASDGAVGLAISGTILSFYTVRAAGEGPVFAGFIPLIVACLAGPALGFLYNILLKIRLASDELLAVAVAMVVFAAGVSSLMGLPPLFPAFLTGLVLANTSDRHDKLYTMLAKAERPLFAFLLIIMGLSWNILEPVGLAAGIIFVLARTAGKVLGVAVSESIGRIDMRRYQGLGLALTGQGGVSVAIALNYAVLLTGRSTGLLISAVTAAFIMNGIISPFFVRRYLRSQTA